MYVYCIIVCIILKKRVFLRFFPGTYSKRALLQNSSPSRLELPTLQSVCSSFLIKMLITSLLSLGWSRVSQKFRNFLYATRYYFGSFFSKSAILQNSSWSRMSRLKLSTYSRLVPHNNMLVTSLSSSWMGDTQKTLLSNFIKPVSKIDPGRVKQGDLE